MAGAASRILACRRNTHRCSQGKPTLMGRCPGIAVHDHADLHLQDLAPHEALEEGDEGRPAGLGDKGRRVVVFSSRNPCPSVHFFW
jgi:hypothetical protein